MSHCYFQTANASMRVGGALNIRFHPTESFGGSMQGIYSTDQENEIQMLRDMAHSGRSGITEITQAVYEKKATKAGVIPPSLKNTAVKPKVIIEPKSAPEEKTFYTCGNLGDIIYCLPTIRAMGGGILLIGPEQTCPKAPTRTPMTRELFDIIAPLLRIQPYIRDVKWVDRAPKAHWDFNQFRLTYFDRTKNLAYAMLNHAGLTDFHADRAWLHVDRTSGEWPKCVINRTERYQNPEFDWKSVLNHYGSEAVFIGLESEHKDFVKRFGKIPHRKTKDLLEVALLLKNAQLFVGNQSCVRAIAEGLKIPVIVEESPKFPDTHFVRPAARYGSSTIPDWPILKNTALITISLLCYNRLDLTEACLASVLEHSPNAHVIVSNNNSWDGTFEYLEDLKKRHSNLTVIHNEDNIGFGPAHNQAFDCCETPYFLVMNNDIVVCPGWLETLVSPLEKNPMVAQTGLRNTCTRLTAEFEGTNGPPNEYCEGSLTMVRAEAVRALPDGLFADYVRFIYGEDSDLSLRLQENGWKVEHVHLPIKHAHSSTITGLPLRTKQFIKRVKAANHAFLRDRWNLYLRKRRFDYSVLIKRKGAHGDVLLTTPVIHAIKLKWPEARISVQTDHPEIFARNPEVSHAFQRGAERMAFDFVYDLDMAYEGDRRRHVLDCYADACDLDASYIVDRLPRIYPASTDFGNLSIAYQKERVCIHPGPTTWAGKNWPKERWADVVRRIKKAGFSACTIGAKDSYKVDGADDLSGKLSIHGTAALLENCAFFIGLDSFPAHMAQAMRVPAIVLFGETRPECLYHPSKFYPVCADPKDVPCAGEHYLAREPRTSSKCNGECMSSIAAETVIREMEKVVDMVRSGR